MSHVLRAPAAPYINIAAVLESQHPVIDLRIADYEVSTRKFLKAVQNYTNKAMEEITQRKIQHAQELKKVAEKKQLIEAETTACKVKEIKLMEVLEREQAERKDAESSVSELKRQLALIKEKCASVDVEIEQYRADVESLRREKRKESSVLEGHASRATPELRECEKRLRCIVEGVDKDRLLVRFAHVDDSDPSCDFSIVIDVSSRQYKAPISTPPLPTLPILVDELNKTRDVYLFIKNVRSAFRDSSRHL